MTSQISHSRLRMTYETIYIYLILNFKIKEIYFHIQTARKRSIDILKK